MGNGGGAYCLNSSVHFNHTTFLENRASSGMGLYNVNSFVDISGCAFKSHDGFYESEGWVIYHVGGTLTVSNSDFIENTALYSNRGVFNNSDWSEFVGCRFMRTSGQEGGPPLYNYYTSATITDCIFEGNDTDEGGAGAIGNYYSNPQIINCIFVKNYSYRNGAISNWESSPEIINCTFVDNDGCCSGGDIIGSIQNRNNSSPMITNNIFWQFDYRLTDSSQHIVNDASSTATVTFSNIDQDGFEGLNGNIRQDPLFYDTGWDDNGTPDDPSDDVWIGGDYHLQQDSPCINAGDNAALSTTVSWALNLPHVRIRIPR